MKVVGMILIVLTPFAWGQSAESDRALQQARQLESQGKLREATRAFQTFLEQYPQDLRALGSLGVVLARQARYDEAVATYKKALAINSRLPEIHLNLGIAYFKMESFQAAIPPLRRALSLQPSNLQARGLLGMAY